jgi:hypothetical protein
MISGKKSSLHSDALKYQPFFFAGDAEVLRACWAKLSDRKKKELIHFDSEQLIFWHAPACISVT